MIRILFGMLLGAAFVYLLDSRQLDDRKQMLKDRIGRGKVGDFTERADQALQVGRDSIVEAKDRVTTTASHAADRARETVDEAKTEAQGWADATRERADSVANGTTTKKS